MKEFGIFVSGLTAMVWHMFVVKKLASAAFLVDKVKMFMVFLNSVIQFLTYV